MKINTTKWGEFKLIDDLDFKVYHGTRITKKERVDGNIIFLTAGKENCGVVGKIGNDVEIWNCPITIDMFGNAIYHDYDCAGDDNIYAFTCEKYNAFHKMFIASSINVVTTKSFSYVDQFRQDNADGLTVNLPIDKKGKPDWKYMENYIKSIEAKVKSVLQKLELAKNSKEKFVDVQQWNDFTISDLFNVVKGKRLTKANMKEGNNRFIGASAKNNGVTHLIGNTDNIHNLNVLTVAYNGSVGETFYQDEKFIASDDVNVFYPKFAMNKYIGLFIAPIIRHIGKNKYEFIDKWKKEDMETEKIKLPVDKQGNPDLKYMENYMRKVEKKVQNNLQYLQAAV